MIEILLLVLLSGIGYQMPDRGFDKNADPEKALSTINNEFSFKIFKMLSKDDNDVMSSLSILSAFNILMNGANGETRVDMKRFLEYKSVNQESDEQTINEGFQKIADKYHTIVPPNSGEEIPVKEFSFDPKDFQHELNLANRVIHDRKTQLLSEFVNVVKQYFKGEVQTADFENNGVEETKKVNDWVRNQTNDKIQKIFDQIEKDTTLIIINVLYFKGHWEEEFPVGSTKKMDFHNNGVTAVQTDMMTNEEKFNYAECSELDSQILELDYMGGNISFVIVSPKQKNGLSSLQNQINAQNFERCLKSMSKRNTRVFLPKFKFEKSYDLMKDINPKPIALTRNANFSRMATRDNIVSQVQHKVFIGLDEKGTEAAAVTAIKMVPMSAIIHYETMLFKADHPFLYFIRDKSNSMILFSGQINKL